ncbi:Gfo/Idh/MocA family protein [Alkalibacterium kapii]|uniref:Dehydrogenase n=1 Tax=Alkalibacterium kapii TaxID=426704 RepID=A0A511B1G1_9LACT|nr:Gfo/Idh/MocA family oxidoreductase [Alkalibacterium kapii]GEK91657.1 dehydrogenase [Alkalibacterium kapii]
MDSFGWAYIGCGSIAQTTAKELMQTDDQKIVAVWNRTRSKAEDFVDKYGGVVYDSAEEAINGAGVEGVYVKVNGDKHAEYTNLAIKNGKAVLCEKPFAMNKIVTKEVFDYAEAQDVYVSEAMWTWHNDTALKVKEWVKSGVIGKPIAVNCTFAVPLLEESSNPRLTTASMLGGALLDLGVYTVRYCYELFGLPETIHCEGVVKKVDYSETITFQYSDYKAHLFISMTEDAGHYFEIKGTQGTIYAPNFHAAKHANLKVDGRQEVFETNDLLYAKQFINVAKDIRLGRKESEKVTAQSTIDVMGLLDECRRQMELVYPEEKRSDKRK